MSGSCFFLIIIPKSKERKCTRESVKILLPCYSKLTYHSHPLICWIYWGPIWVCLSTIYIYTYIHIYSYISMVEPCNPPLFHRLTQHFWCDFLGFSSISSHGFKMTHPWDFQPGIGGGLWQWNGAGRVVRGQRPGAGCGSEGTLAGRLGDGDGATARQSMVISCHFSPEIQKQSLGCLG